MITTRNCARAASESSGLVGGPSTLPQPNPLPTQSGLSVSDLIRRQPTLLHLDPEANVKPTLEALYRMFGTAKPAEVMRLVRTQPSLLSYDTGALEAKVNGLSELMNMTSDETARLVVGRAPGLLTLSLDENLRPSFEVLQELIPGVSASTVVRRAPSLLGYSSNTLRGKLAALQKALPTVDIAKLVSLAPSLLTQSVQHNTYRKIRTLRTPLALLPRSHLHVHFRFFHFLDPRGRRAIATGESNARPKPLHVVEGCSGSVGSEGVPVGPFNRWVEQCTMVNERGGRGVEFGEPSVHVTSTKVRWYSVVSSGIR